MRIAIIGGGGAGVVTAYLLNEAHDVVLYERQPHLGGNVRTVGKNVEPQQGLPAGVFLENGVLGFHKRSYPQFHRLMVHLGVDVSDYLIHSGLFLEDGRYFLTPSVDLRKRRGLVTATKESLRSLSFASRILRQKRLLRSMLRRDPQRLMDQALSDVLRRPDDSLEQWFRSGIMLSFSNSYARMDGFPAALGVAHLITSANPFWSGVKGGVFTYFERILARLDSARQFRLGQPVTAVTRGPDGVTVTARGSEPETFDQVVFATTPEQVLRILGDPTDAERERFGPWEDNPFATICHRSTAMYDPYDTDVYSPCDFFAKDGGKDYGYNTYLNTGYDLPRDTHYSFAFNLDEYIPEDAIIDRFTHRTPAYTVEAFRQVREIRAANGERRTWFAGAYLDGGLHEGAVTSALAVAGGLGGRSRL